MAPIRLLFMNVDPVAELHTVDYFGEPPEAAQSTPIALGDHAQLEDHAEHAVAGEAAFTSRCASAKWVFSFVSGKCFPLVGVRFNRPPLKLALSESDS